MIKHVVKKISKEHAAGKNYIITSSRRWSFLFNWKSISFTIFRSKRFIKKPNPKTCTDRQNFRNRRRLIRAHIRATTTSTASRKQLCVLWRNGFSRVYPFVIIITIISFLSTIGYGSDARVFLFARHELLFVKICKTPVCAVREIISIDIRARSVVIGQFVRP